MTVIVDPVTFGVQFLPEDPSPLQHWNEVLRGFIAADGIGPTRSSRAFALLNTGFYDLWAATDPVAAPVYGSPEPLEDDVPLGPLLDGFAYQLLNKWFPEAELPDRADLTPLAADLQQHIDRQVDSIPSLDPWSEAPVPSLAGGRDIALWNPEHVPIDDPSAPLEEFLTPRWGSIPAFSTADVSGWRPQGPEPFLLLDEAKASFELSSGELTLKQAVQLPDAELKPPGVYSVGDRDEQQWLVGEVINPDFIAQAQQVVDIQDSLSDEQMLTAEFWESGAGTAFPPANWMAFAGWASDRDQLSLSEQIKLYFSVGQAVGDAGIAAWDAKWHFNYARPVRVIRDLDALNLLEGENLQEWMTYQAPGSNSSPPFAEYVSGHSAFSAAAAEALSTYLGSNDFDLAIDFLPGSSRFRPGVVPAQTTTLHWPTFTEAADQAGMSRLYGGIHFADGNDHGLTLGYQVGRDVLKTAAGYAYAHVDQNLLEPFTIRNQLKINPNAEIILDDYVLPDTLRQINLSSGDDQISLLPGAGFDGVVDAGGGADQLSYESWTQKVEVDLTSGSATGFEQIAGVEHVISGSGADHLVGSSADESFLAGGGDDRIHGGPGFDTAIFSGQRRDYHVESEVLLDQRFDGDGADLLSSIEWLQFSDGIWPHHEIFQLPTQELSADLMPLSLSAGSEFAIPLTYGVSDGAINLSGIDFGLRYPSDLLQFLEFEPSDVAQAGLWQVIDVPGQSLLQLSFSSKDAGESWPGPHGGHLAMSLGELLFQLKPETQTFGEDTVTGLQLVPVATADGYGFEAKNPELKLTPSWSLDIDRDGEVSPLTDGLMVMRYLTGTRGDALINQALGADATRRGAAEIDAWISDGLSHDLLDLDGDGRTSLLGDGLMLMRSLFGMRGESVIKQAISTESPLLDGYSLNHLNGEERRWVAHQVQERIDSLT